MKIENKIKIVNALVAIKIALGEHTKLINEANELVKEPDGNFMDYQTVKEGFDGVEIIQNIIKNL